jgi:hypothetical protein
LALAVGLIAATSHLAAQSQGPTQYTVDWVLSGGPMTMSMHVLRDGDRQRIDMEMPSMAPSTMQFYMCQTSTIVRPDQKKAFVVTHYKKEYMEKGFNPKLDMTDPRTEAVKVEELGSEAIEGEDCLKSRLTMEQGPMLMWTSKKTGMMRRMMQEGGRDGMSMMIDAKNVQMGAPPEGSFEIPDGYKQMGGSSEVAKGVFGSMASGIASAFMPNIVGSAAAAAQARAQQAKMQEDAQLMAKNCKPGQMPGMPAMPTMPRR